MKADAFQTGALNRLERGAFLLGDCHLKNQGVSPTANLYFLLYRRLRPARIAPHLNTQVLRPHNQSIGISGRSSHLFRELRPAVSVMEGENGHSNASQSGVGQRFFAPGARTHVVSPSPSPTGVKMQVARKRGCDVSKKSQDFLSV